MVRRAGAGPLPRNYRLDFTNLQAQRFFRMHGNCSATTTLTQTKGLVTEISGTKEYHFFGPSLNAQIVGDFEITVAYELNPVPAAPNGSTVGAAIWLETKDREGQSQQLRFHDVRGPDGQHRFTVDRFRDAALLTPSKSIDEYHPTGQTAPRGRLRLVRIKDRLYFQVPEGRVGFHELHPVSIDDAKITGLHFVGQSWGGPPGVTLQWKAIDIHCRDFHAPYKLGTNLLDREQGLFDRFATGGWAVSDPWGVWSIAKRAELVLAIGKSHARSLVLKMRAKAYLAPTHTDRASTSRRMERCSGKSSSTPRTRCRRWRFRFRGKP